MPGKEELILIHRYLSGSMQEPEQQEFEHRLTQEPSLARLKEELAVIWAASVQYTAPQFDSQKGYKTFQQNLQPTRVNRPVWFVSAAAVILVLIVGGIYLQRESITLQDVQASSFTARILKDGSKLELRPGAHLRIPESFRGRARKIEIVRGEIFFEIAPDKARPFIIRHDWAQVKVVGTEFAISIDTTEHTFTLRVTEGEVTFTPQLSKQTIPVRAGTGLTFDADTRIIEFIPNLDPNSVSWHTGVVTFNDTPMKAVVADLMHHYGIRIELTNSTIEECRFTAPLPYKDVPVTLILDAVSTTFGMTLKEVSTGHYVLSNGICSLENE